MKPVGKANLIHQLLLAGLVATKPTSWNHRTIDLETGDLVTKKVVGTALSNPLAANVAAENVDRAARRWAA